MSQHVMEQITKDLLASFTPSQAANFKKLLHVASRERSGIRQTLGKLYAYATGIHPVVGFDPQAKPN